MQQDWYSVEQVADRLGLHVRTVRSYVRDGRLEAVRIGKQYRIARADLEALTGRPTAAPTRGVQVTSIVDVDAVDAPEAERIAGVLTGLPRGTAEPRPRIETVHDPARARLKILVVARLDETVELLRFVRTLTEDAA
ncbi:helix-turn-helix domain-containing protein [Pseudonocardia sichuanensis]